ncbi:MAG: hypothetical protein HYX79_01405 [Chloroflexi bacterium]|nr:hypothetical protein [Chloroflexota bacterium]
MKTMRHNPHLYEINARIFVRRLSEKYGRQVTLASVPEEEWQWLAGRGFDIVWLMGVWQRSPGSRQKALHHPGLRHEYSKTLPGWTEKDVAGSPYAIYGYTLDSALGDQNELARVRSQINRLGMRLMVDFVPNHLALDHPWTVSHPERFVQAKKTEVRSHPDWFFPTNSGVYLAHGRDPYFPPWTDTAQVNFYSTDLRKAFMNEMLRIADTADGMRYDMAMLALNEVFERIWSKVLGDYPRLKTEFWAEAIGRVREKHPDFIFLAEAYWGLEHKLQQLGFDFTYDKDLYDRLRSSPPADIRRALVKNGHSARFIENHDEPRAVVAFGRERSLAAAVIMATIPGLRFFHDGQLEGRRGRLPIQLAREQSEVIDSEVLKFYERLLAITSDPAFHDGEWSLMDVTRAWDGNESHQNLLAWSWQHGEKLKLVVVNYSPGQAQGRIKVELPGTTQKAVFTDELAGVSYLRDPKEIRNPGLYVDLGTYKAHMFDVGGDSIVIGPPSY